MKSQKTDYQSIFDGVETTLFEVGSKILPIENIKENLEWFKNLEGKILTDNEYYWILVYVIFYAGFRAATVTAKLDSIRKYFSDYEVVSDYGDGEVSLILADSEMLRNRRKIKACVDNAIVFKDIVNSYGSFRSYVESFVPLYSFENLMLLKENLEYRFSGLGIVTTYHFLTDIGLPVLKPDRVICRIFQRLGLIESNELLLSTVIQGRKFARVTGHPIRYIDIIFVAYGQMKSEELGIKKGICLEKNPSCEICGIKKYCNYSEQRVI